MAVFTRSPVIFIIITFSWSGAPSGDWIHRVPQPVGWYRIWHNRARLDPYSPAVTTHRRACCRPRYCSYLRDIDRGMQIDFG
jgi:hypothetical protein